MVRPGRGARSSRGSCRSSSTTRDACRRTPARMIRPFTRPHWGHSTAWLRGKLDVDAVHALPERFRVGLFASNASYQVVGRPGTSSWTGSCGLAVGRIAMRAAYPTLVPNVDAPSGQANDSTWLLVEGSPQVNGPGHVFFARDARMLAMLGTVAPASRETARTLLTPRYLPLFARFAKEIRRARAFAGRPPATTTGWAGKAYYSLGPFALGDGAMKSVSVRGRPTTSRRSMRPRVTRPATPRRDGSLGG